jgi:hypothetical protein
MGLKITTMKVTKYRKIKDISDEELAEIIYNEGINYIEERYGESDLAGVIASSRIWWTWWKMLWMSVDTELDRCTDNFIGKKVYIDFHQKYKRQCYVSSAVVSEIKKELTHKFKNKIEHG